MEHEGWHSDMPEMVIVYAAVNVLGILVGILVGLAF
jgi:hypothetical protein